MLFGRHTRKHWVRSLPAILLVTMMACVQTPPPRVGLKPLTADLVFGIPEVDEPVSVPDVVDPQPLRLEPGPTFDPPDLTREAPECPDATLNVVDDPVGSEIKGRPQEGTYRWKELVDQLIENPINPAMSFRTKVERLRKRTIHKVADAEAPAEFTFAVVNETEEQYFEVITGVKETGGVNLTQQQGNVNGIYLTKIVSYPEGQDPQVFNARPPILYLPLPPTGGFTRSTTAVDPESFETRTMSINVRKPQRWDACGQMIEGWFVDAEVEITQRGNRVKYDYNYAIALQFGGILIAEDILFPCEAKDAQGNCIPEPKLIYNANQGQIAPSPIKEGDIPEKAKAS